MNYDHDYSSSHCQIHIVVYSYSEYVYNKKGNWYEDLHVKDKENQMNPE